MTFPKFNEGTMVFIKAGLYFFIAFLAPIEAVYRLTAEHDYWPTHAKIFAALLAGLLSGLVSLKAFLDGSNARYEDNKQTNKEIGG